jgi:polar amino acid transport system permease protein
MATPGTDRQAVRAAAKHRRDRRSAAIATVSTVVVVGGLIAFLVTRPGWSSVHELFFNWGVFTDAFPQVLSAFWIDVKLFLIVEAAVLVFGLLVALGRTSRHPVLFPVRLLTTLYVDVFRGIPTILVVYLVGFGVPAIQMGGLPTDPLVLGGIALGLSYGAYVAEVYRSGLQTVPASQRRAALSVGLSHVQTLRFVILPQAVRNVRAPLLNDFISLQKDVALVAILGPQEAYRIAQILQGEQFNYTPLLAAALLYLCVTIPLARVLDRMNRRDPAHAALAVR